MTPHTFAAATTDVRPSAPPDTGSSFRHLLRHATRPDHDRVEALFAVFMEHPATTLDWFLTAQLSAFVALCAASDGAVPEAERAALDHIIAVLSQDTRAVPVPPPHTRLSGDAVSYILLGSRLGTKVMARRLTAAGHDLPAYFSSTVDDGLWPALCARLSTVVPDSIAAQRILADTRIGFALFHSAAQAAHPALDTTK